MNTQSLTSLKCEVCEHWQKPLSKDQYEPLLKQVIGWEVVEDKKIEKRFVWKDFKQALLFINKVGELAEAENHHPNISLYSWNKVKLTLTTHNIKGLSKNDFIMAAKIDQIQL